MKTSQKKLEEMLLSGRHINKIIFYQETGTLTLTQRIYDIRDTKGWFIRSKSVEGKGTLREYWLDPAEIARIKGTGNAPLMPTIPPIPKPKEEMAQSSLGLFGENKYER